VRFPRYEGENVRTIHFQFSLWDSPSFRRLARLGGVFNSLCEIPSKGCMTTPGSPIISLSILFVRFGGMGKGTGKEAGLSILFVRFFSQDFHHIHPSQLFFQFSLWDSYKPDRANLIAVELSILFVRFRWGLTPLADPETFLSILFVRFFFNWRRFWCGLRLSILFVRFFIPYTIPFTILTFNSLCEIRSRILAGHRPFDFLSILFVRFFCHVRGRNDAHGFQFSLWDSRMTTQRLFNRKKTFNSLCEIR